MTKKEVNNPTWFVIVTVVIISTLVCLTITLIYREKFHWVIPAALLFNLCWELIPYGFLIVLWKKIAEQKSINKKYGIRGALVLLILSQAFFESIFWISAYTPPHDTTFILGAFLSTSAFVGGIGYGIGYIIGYFSEKRRE